MELLGHVILRVYCFLSQSHHFTFLPTIYRGSSSFVFLLVLVIFHVLNFYLFFSPHLRAIFFIAFREEGRDTWMRERSIDCLPPICAQTREQTRKLGMCPHWDSNPHLLVMRQYSNQLIHTSQGSFFFFLFCFVLVLSLPTGWEVVYHGFNLHSPSD